jgi:uncharacterized Zn finger protein
MTDDQYLCVHGIHPDGHELNAEIEGKNGKTVRITKRLA